MQPPATFSAPITRFAMAGVEGQAQSRASTFHCTTTLTALQGACRRVMPFQRFVVLQLDTGLTALT